MRSHFKPLDQVSALLLKLNNPDNTEKVTVSPTSWLPYEYKSFMNKSGFNPAAPTR